LLTGNNPAASQVTKAEAILDTSSIMIGDQIVLSLKLDVPDKSEIYWPYFTGDSVAYGVEILEARDVDTLRIADDYMRYHQDLLITSFDSGFYKIRPIPFKFKLKGDTSEYFLQTLPLDLEVTNPEVDLNADIKTIKPPLEAPFTLSEILPHIGIGLAVLLVAAAIIYILVKRKRKEPILSPRRKPALPAHLQALKDLEEVKRKKLWQAGKVKEYYTLVTDVVRWYIEQRYAVPALEMTTEETFNGLKHADIGNETSGKLHKTLILADLVKFAKEQPLPVDNDQCMDDCIDFINQTRPGPETIELKNDVETEKISA